jgi:hypothetical protein
LPSSENTRITFFCEAFTVETWATPGPVARSASTAARAGSRVVRTWQLTLSSERSYNRVPELGAVDRLLDRMPTGPAALVIEGEAGIGKTTVWLEEVEERAPARGQLHRRRQAALDDREVASREVAVKLVDVGANVDSPQP